MSHKLKVAIIGSNGYTGYELVRLLLHHSKIELVYLGSRAFKDEPYSKVYPQLHKLTKLKCKDEDINFIATQAELIFTATPHGFLAGVLNEKVLENAKIIDLGADFRLKDYKIYEKYYKLNHQNTALLKEAVYGLCELKRAEIKKARLIANPGCYTTCSILSLYPLVKEKIIDLHSIIIDAKSGVSGAGRGAKMENLFCELNENFKAYALKTHRHTPEIEQFLSQVAQKEVILQFSPHLVPMQRGILCTIYAKACMKISEKELQALYADFYKDERFIRVVHQPPQTAFVRGTNFVDLYPLYDERTKNIIIISSLDNLIKGAAGQAVQNMNIIFGYDEALGLENLAMI